MLSVPDELLPYKKSRAYTELIGIGPKSCNTLLSTANIYFTGLLHRGSIQSDIIDEYCTVTVGLRTAAVT